ncbi:hypothetical protein K501DRAFT_278494 [Backusella circina FSU 941]|nr:hypothetical protein K501DRAFT_278494 [Backusella circina FSU 941]
MSNKDNSEYPDVEKVASSVSSQKEDGDTAIAGTKRSLQARHVQMIAIGSTIGTGIFLNSGRSIAEGGPGGALVAYCVISGSIYQYATRFMDRSLGFALGVNVWWSMNMSLAAELTSAARTIRFWGTVMPDAAWASIFWVIVVTTNLFSVRLYGEIEYWFCLFKVLIVIVFIIVAILLTSGAIGGPTIGFELKRKYLLISPLNPVALVAGETQNPTKAIPRAVRSVFWRVLIFYVATILLLGMCIPYDDPRLSFTNSDASTGSFTLVFEKAGIEAGAHVINAAVLISLLSAANSVVYSSSRLLLGLAQDRNMPRLLTSVNRYGAPYCAVLGSGIITFGCIFISIYSASTVLVWCLHLSSIAGFIHWAYIGYVQIRFRRGYVLQGRDLKDLPYKASFYPYGPIFVIVLSVVIILAQGYSSFYPKWNAVTFVANYIGIIPFVSAYGLHKIITKSKIVPLEDIDYETGTMSKFDVEFDNQNDSKWKMSPCCLLFIGSLLL